MANTSYRSINQNTSRPPPILLYDIRTCLARACFFVTDVTTEIEHQEQQMSERNAMTKTIEHHYAARLTVHMLPEAANRARDNLCFEKDKNQCGKGGQIYTESVSILPKRCLPK